MTQKLVQLCQARYACECLCMLIIKSSHQRWLLAQHRATKSKMANACREKMDLATDPQGFPNKNLRIPCSQHLDHLISYNGSLWIGSAVAMMLICMIHNRWQIDPRTLLKLWEAATVCYPMLSIMSKHIVTANISHLDVIGKSEHSLRHCWDFFWNSRGDFPSPLHVISLWTQRDKWDIKGTQTWHLNIC